MTISTYCALAVCRWYDLRSRLQIN